MSFALIIQDSLEVHLDVVEIAQSLNETHAGLGSDFVAAVGDTLARLEERLLQPVQVRFAPKFEDIYGEPVKADRDSPIHAKNFQDYYLYYLLEEEKKEAILLAVAYGPRNPEYLKRLLSGRK